MVTMVTLTGRRLLSFCLCVAGPVWFGRVEDLITKSRGSGAQSNCRADKMAPSAMARAMATADAMTGDLMGK